MRTVRAPSTSPASTSSAATQVRIVVRQRAPSDRVELGRDVIFFADEGGAWAVSVDWRRVMPAWFRCLSMTATPEEYASRIIEAVDDLEHASRDKDKRFAEAAHVGNAEQRAALLEHAR